MSQQRTRSALLVTLTLLCGLHVLRVFLPTLIWYLSRHLPIWQLALYTLGTVALVLLAPAVRYWLGERGALALTGGGLVLVRLAIQVVDAPTADLALATVGLVLWGWFLSLWHSSPRNRPSGSAVPVLVVAFPLAFLLDTGSRSLLWSYDLAWRRDLWATLIVVVLAGLALVLLWRELTDGPTAAAEESPPDHIWPLLGLGPWLYLALALFHNPAAWVAATGWADAPAHLAVNVCAALGAVTCVLAAGGPARRRWPWALLDGGLLVGALVLFTADVEPAGLWLALASWTAWAALGWVLEGTARPEPRRPGLWRTTLAAFLALLLMLVTGFLAFEPLSVRAAEWPFLAPLLLPVVAALATGYRLVWVPPAAGAVLLLTATGAARGSGSRVGTTWRAGGVVGVVAGVVLLVVGVWCLADTPPQPSAMPLADRPLRVMAYNIHQGLNADMRMDLAAIAAVIAAEDPDVVALNEVNRARAFNGFVDTLPLISRHTGLPYVFGANYADGQYGNAVLSRYPILAWDNAPYQHNTTEVRGLLRVVVDAPGGPITFYATHLDHTGGSNNAREAQVVEILARWDRTPRTVLLGDLNARPGQTELRPIYDAGFVDALAVTGQDQAFTIWDPVPKPGRRIDYIFLTPDLALGRVWVVQTRASDHLPVLAEVRP